MTDVSLNPITSGYNTSKLNSNFTAIQDSINSDLINRTGGNNIMDQDLDLNSNNLLNVAEIDASIIRLDGDVLNTSPFVISAAYDATLAKKADLASPAAGKGAEMVGYGGSNVGSALDGIYNTIYPAALFAQAGLQNEVYAAGALKNAILLQKKRTDRAEFVVYTPLSVDGISWCRWLFTNRFNVSATGSPRMYRCSLANLYRSIVAAIASANLATGTMAQAAVSTKGTADADSVTGTWTAAATVSGVTDIRYSTTPGDKVVYTLTGVNRIAIRSLGNATNGGIVAVVVKSGGVEIAGGYTVPLVSGERRIDLDVDNGYSLPGGNYYTVADGLATGTYTVEISVSAANTQRGYDGGVVGYAALAYNALGRMGTWDNTTLNGVTYVYARAAGAAVVYKVTGTRVDWKYGAVVNAAIVSVRVYDSTGAEIPDSNYEVAGKAVDCYGTASALVQTTIADDLPLGDYYLVVQGTPTKNASGTGYRVYDAGAVGIDNTSAGILGTDPFDDHNVNDDAAIEPPFTLIGTGNLEVAISARKPSESAGTESFVGGVHGNESTPATVAFTLDGAAIDFAGGAIGATWIGGTLAWTCASTLSFASDSSAFANLSYACEVSRAGYQVSLTRAMTADAMVVEDYCLMLNAPNTSGGANNQGIDGGFEQFSSFTDDVPIRTFTTYADGHIPLPYVTRLGAFFNSGYIVIADQLNAKDISNTYAGKFDGSRELSFVQTRSDDFIKWYNRPFSGSGSGVLVPTGDTYTNVKSYRVIARSLS